MGPRTLQTALHLGCILHQIRLPPSLHRRQAEGREAPAPRSRRPACERGFQQRLKDRACRGRPRARRGAWHVPPFPACAHCEARVDLTSSGGTPPSSRKLRRQYCHRVTQALPAPTARATNCSCARTECATQHRPCTRALPRSLRPTSCARARSDVWSARPCTTLPSTRQSRARTPQQRNGRPRATPRLRARPGAPSGPPSGRARGTEASPNMSNPLARSSTCPRCFACCAPCSRGSKGLAWVAQSFLKCEA
mmetsp:Transcript_10750/g.44438  ORF Transcript_10750/g.44438 Transcript_10750/m.44438 type:complete len:252 (+) Transcript_10750:4005-4760(+)